MDLYQYQYERCWYSSTSSATTGSTRYQYNVPVQKFLRFHLRLSSRSVICHVISNRRIDPENMELESQHPLPLPLPLPLPGSDSDDNTDEVYDTTACTVPDRPDDDATRTSKLRSFSSSTDVRKTIATQAIHRGTKSIELKGAFRSFKRHSIVNPSFASAATPMSSQDASSRHTSEVAFFKFMFTLVLCEEEKVRRWSEHDHVYRVLGYR